MAPAIALNDGDRHAGCRRSRAPGAAKREPARRRVVVLGAQAQLPRPRCARRRAISRWSTGRHARLLAQRMAAAAATTCRRAAGSQLAALEPPRPMNTR